MSSLDKCAVCDTKHPGFRWTDTHGVGACLTCGTTYRIYRYGEDGKRLAGPPAITLKPEWIDLHRRAFADLRHNVMPGAYNMPGSSYEVATRADADAVNAWFEAHKSEWPEQPESEGVA